MQAARLVERKILLFAYILELLAVRIAALTYIHIYTHTCMLGQQFRRAISCAAFCTYFCYSANAFTFSPLYAHCHCHLYVVVVAVTFAIAHLHFTEISFSENPSTYQVLLRNPILVGFQANSCSFLLFLFVCCVCYLSAVVYSTRVVIRRCAFFYTFCHCVRI